MHERSFDNCLDDRRHTVGFAIADYSRICPDPDDKAIGSPIGPLIAAARQRDRINS